MFNAIIALAALAVSAFGDWPPSQSAHVPYNTMYDHADLPLSSLVCANTPLSDRFPTIGSLPTTNVGGAFAITGSDTSECGTCWALTANGVTVNMLAIDAVGSDFVVARSTLDALTGGMGNEQGAVDVQFEKVDPSACGL